MKAFTEDKLIKQAAIQLMCDELGWTSVNAYDDPPLPRLRRRGWAEGQEELTLKRTALSMVRANREIDRLLSGGRDLLTFALFN